MIDAVIFDMDGVILDSEPFWQESEMEIFKSVGITLTREQCIETTGLPVNDVVAFRYKQKPWKNKSIAQISDDILTAVELKVRKNAVLMEGVANALVFFKNHSIPLALASSSSMRLISTVLSKFSLEKEFRAVHSSESEEYGKPHPAVFLTTAAQLSVKPDHCLVIEDSFNGLIAAKAARMKTIIIPMPEQLNETRFDIADLKLGSLKEFSKQHWDYLNALP